MKREDIKVGMKVKLIKFPYTTATVVAVDENWISLDNPIWTVMQNPANWEKVEDKEDET